MRRSYIIVIVFSIVSLTMFSGCFGVNGQFKSIRNAVLLNTDKDFERDIEFSVGPAGLALAGMFVRFADDQDGRNISEMIGEISRVQIGVYKNRDRFDRDVHFNFLREINDEMEGNGWQYIVRAVDHNELAAVYVRTDAEENIREAFIVALSREDLVFANIYGDLDGLIETAIRQNGIHFEMADN